MDGTQATILAGAIASGLTLLTQVITILNTNFKEARNRRWAEEDRRLLAEQAAKDKEELAATTRHKLKETEQAIKFQFDEMRELQREIKHAGEERLRQIVAKVDENTQISAKAFDTANNVNEKIAAIGIEIRDKVVSGTHAAPQEVLVVNDKPIEVTETHAKPTKSRSV